MAPIKTYSNWNKCSGNAEEQIAPYRRYYFICEGKILNGGTLKNLLISERPCLYTLIWKWLI